MQRWPTAAFFCVKCSRRTLEVRQLQACECVPVEHPSLGSVPGCMSDWVVGGVGRMAHPRIPVWGGLGLRVICRVGCAGVGSGARSRRARSAVVDRVVV